MAGLNGQGEKRSLFQASPFGSFASVDQVSDEESDEDFFSRSKQTYAILAAEKEVRNKRKAEREAEVVVGLEPATPQSGKKSKITNVNQEDASQDENLEKVLPSHTKVASEPATGGLSMTLESGTSGLVDAASAPEHKPTISAEIIDLEKLSDKSADDLSEQTGGTQDVTSRVLHDPVQLPVSAKFRDGRSEQNDDSATDSNNLSTTQDRTTISQEPVRPPPQAAVTLLITSSIPDTCALKVRRRLDQRLKEVRIDWCKRQNLDDEKIKDIVLVWRDKQVYDSTSCHGLGIRVDAAGTIFHKASMDPMDGADDEIHIEAMTRQMFRERKEVRSSTAASQNKERSSDAVPVPATSQTERRLRLILKSKDYEEVKLVVKESQHVQRLMVAFRDTNGLPQDLQLSLRFDGEELDAAAAVSAYELGDMDTIDVYTKV